MFQQGLLGLLIALVVIVLYFLAWPVPVEPASARGMKGDLPQGDDLVGLSRAFIHAVTPSVVASLWRVSDDSTVVMMRSFYRNLRSMSKAEALRQSQVELATANSEAFSHPFFWAPFILVGDWN